MNIRTLFQQHLAQTSPSPIALHITKAKDCHLWDADGKKYLDLIGGISVCNVGHSREEVVNAVKDQCNAYMHIMVYGELIQSPQVLYATQLTQYLPQSLNSVYFTNSGAEATEGAIKLAKRFTGRPKIIAANKSYHGNTTGALAIMGDEYWRNAFRPLMPGIHHYDFNSEELIQAIDDQTACVVLETVQAEAGVIAPKNNWLKKVRDKCTQTQTLLVIDEIQCGFGRTGTLWAFERYDIVPDILLLGKALGGGMPLGAFISERTIMQTLTENPVLGHITTFGGHPVCCAAGEAAFQLLLKDNLFKTVQAKEALFHKHLSHPAIRQINSCGLLLALYLDNPEQVLQVLSHCLEAGIFSDWFLYASDALRIAPPLIINHEEIVTACSIIKKSIELTRQGN
ncbi:MAG: aspartate aminotransferase family protein [Bacteroidetes bacterium]|nr:aspartate aminotransferase family protein [Bacteroidota bacterium]